MRTYTATDRFIMEPGLSVLYAVRVSDMELKLAEVRAWDLDVSGSL